MLLLLKILSIIQYTSKWGIIMIKLIASDMDGSLLTDKNELPPDFFSILDMLHQRGIKFVVASGRSYCTLFDNFAPKSNDIDYIADNGTCVVESGKLTYENILNKSCVIDIVKSCREIKGLHLVLCGKNGSYIKRETGTFLDEINRYYKNKVVMDDLTKVTDEIFKVGIYDMIGSQENSHKILSKQFSDNLAVVMSGYNWTDLMNKNANKGEALLKIQQRNNISKDETMAFGDYYNDIEMLANAKYSFVMENAVCDMKKFGNFVAQKNNDYGVIKAIKKFVFNED